MFCNKCGRKIEENTKFCGGCGEPVQVQNITQPKENVVQNSGKQNIQQNYNINNEQTQTNYNQPYQNYDNIVNPSMKKFAVLSIVIPAISIIIYTFIGLSVYLAIFLSVLGFDFAKKGALYSKKLSKIGYILNAILLAMAIVIWIILIITKGA